MPAPPSSPIDPAIGHLAALAQAAPADPPGLLAVLAKVADPRHRRSVRHRLAVILGLAVCAVLAGARSFTAIAEWAADADRATLDTLGVTGAVPSESTFRRTLQRLDADAFDDLARQVGAAAHRARAEGTAGHRGGRQDLTRLHPRRRRPCSRRWTTPTVWCWARLTWTPRPTRSPCSPRCWTASPSAGRSSPRTRCTPSAATPPTWPGAARTTCSRSSATSPAYSPSSPPCPGGRCPLPATLASAATAGPSGAP